MDRRQAMGVLAGTAVALAAPVRGRAAAGSPVADTAYGKIRGVDRDGVKVFLGVPYGADTGGANRWKPPKPPLKWSGVRDCLDYGPLPPQPTPLVAPWREEGEIAQQSPIGEDCLRINIYTPAVGRNSGRRAVMIWFHGGGFNAGSGSGRTYNGTNLARKQDVVVISVTQRLNHFGFLYLGEVFGEAFADSGNAGTLDMLEVLKWVKANIANFGGDPDRVMVFGQSGGAGKVSTLMGMAKAKGLLHRAACQSGGETPPAIPTSAASGRAKAVIDALGVKTAAEAQALPWKRIVDVAAANRLPGGGMPVIDGRTVTGLSFDPPSPNHKDVPLICLTTETEAAAWNASVDPIDDVALTAQVVRSTQLSDSDANALIGIFKAAYPGRDNAYIGQLVASQWRINQISMQHAERKFSAGGAPVYFLYFAIHGSGRNGRIHTPHCAEIPYVFDSLDFVKDVMGPVTPIQQETANRMSAYWANFAKTGNPNGPGLPRWEPFTVPKRSAMVVSTDGQLAMVDDPWGTTRKAVVDYQLKARGQS